MTDGLAQGCCQRKRRAPQRPVSKMSTGELLQALGDCFDLSREKAIREELERRERLLRSEQ